MPDTSDGKKWFDVTLSGRWNFDYTVYAATPDAARIEAHDHLTNEVWPPELWVERVQVDDDKSGEPLLTWTHDAKSGIG